MQQPGAPPPPVPYAPPPPPPYMPAMGAPPLPTESKATMSLVFGILSLFFLSCYLVPGFLFGVPAIILGSLSRRDIRRSNGTLGGSGMAMAGVVCGAISSGIAVLGVIGIAALVIGVSASSTPTAYVPPPPPPAYTAPYATTAPTIEPVPTALPEGPKSWGSLHVFEPRASAGSLRAQLEPEVRRAAAAKQKVVLWTTASWCKECREIENALTDSSLSTLLSNVALVRVDVDAFRAELATLGMSEPTLPWFFLVGPTLRPIESVSADSWGANTPDNIRPVLRQLLDGTGAPSPSGVPGHPKGTPM